MPWDPGQYMLFDRERLRPALDLLERIPLEAAEEIVDLGCGPGHITRLLQSHWPQARVTGVDHSPEMLKRAAAGTAGIQWQRADLAEWQPDRPVDLIYANASLHWVADHQSLFPRLMTSLNPGGWLAVQMPCNQDRPSHLAAFEVAEQEPWRTRLGPLLRRRPVAEPEVYLRWLSPAANHLDIWLTDYLHLLEGRDPVAAWTRGSLLVPLLEALREAERDLFLEAYRSRLRGAYQQDEEGRTLFWFRRLFLIARAS
jgi:trans-aconitate 2-methyltransferase